MVADEEEEVEEAEEEGEGSGAGQDMLTMVGWDSKLMLDAAMRINPSPSAAGQGRASTKGWRR